ncbi:MAG: ribonuclease HI [Nitrososphaera sp.]
MPVEVYFDGLCQPKNPGGIACYAFVIKDLGKTIHSNYGIAAEPFSKNATNNVAEYCALIKSLEWLVANKMNSAPIVAKSDSKLVVNQLSGGYKVKAKRIIPLYRKVLMLKESFQDFAIKWVPREENREADELTNRAYRETLENNPEYRKRI